MTDLDQAIRASIAAILDTAEDPTGAAPVSDPSVVGPAAARPSRLLVTVSAAAAIVLIIGLVLIVGRTQDAPASLPGITTMWLIDDLPAGWTVISADGPGPIDLDEEEFGTPVAGVLYATADAPSGPIIALTSGLGPPTASSTETNFTELTLAGRRAALTDRNIGTRLLYVEVGDSWVRFETRGMTDDQLLEIGASLTVTADGEPSIDPVSLPPGVGRLPGNLTDLAYLTNGASQSTYGGPSDTIEPLAMNVAPSSLTLAWYALNTETSEPIDIGGHHGYLMRVLHGSPNAMTVVWIQDGFTFAIIGYDLSAEAIVAAAVSVRPAIKAEWDALPSQEALRTEQVEDGDTTTSGPPDTVLASTAPTPNTVDTSKPAATAAGTDTAHTGPPVSSEVISAPSIEDSNASDTTYRDELRPDLPWTSRVSIVFDNITFLSTTDGGGEAQAGQLVDDTDSTQIMPIASDRADFITAASTDSSAHTLRVTTNDGVRISQVMHTNPDHPNVHFAVIAVEPNRWTYAEIVDNDGSIISSVTECTEPGSIVDSTCSTYR